MLVKGATDVNFIENIWDQMAIHMRDMDNTPTTQQQLRDSVLTDCDAQRPKRRRSLLLLQV